MGGFRIVMFLFDSGIFSKTNGALIFGHGLTELGALGEVHQYSVFVVGAAWVFEWGVLVRKEIRSGVRKGSCD